MVTVGRTAVLGLLRQHRRGISLPGERETWFGFLGALRNVGFALGGLVSGLAITIGTDDGVRRGRGRQRGVVRRWPSCCCSPSPRPRSRAHDDDRSRARWGAVLRDRRYRLLVVTQARLLDVDDGAQLRDAGVRRHVLGLPGWVTGAVFTVNTVMVGFGQGLRRRAR